ncbi:MAG: glycosyltransferase [Candidatus Amulumruptor caecigallinarius]|nr:glycosyltransferase [Candidatus Amulumruptor caecigallinarius]
MKIMQVITLCELGGAQSVVSNLSNELVRRGHEVIVVAGEGDGKMLTLLDKRIKTERIPSLVRRLSPLNELKTLVAMRGIYRKYRPDVIQLHSSKAGLLGRLAFPGSKTLYTIHGFDSIRVAYRRFLPLEKVLQHHCSAIVGVSKYDRDNLIKEGITDNVSFVYNGIFPPRHLKEDPFANMNKYKGKILCIARISPQKKPELFADVAALMPDYAFIWIGNQKIPEGNFPDNVFFMGNIPGAGSYTEHADVFFLPSNYEGLPMSIIEALACGTPVVASAVGGIPEILNGKNGFAVENNARKMAEKISEIMASKEAYEAMSCEARNVYAHCLTVERMTDGYLEIYNEITG